MLLPRRKWKDIEGYEGYYQVSNIGEVRSVDRWVTYKNGRKIFRKGKLMKLSPGTCGYPQVSLCSHGVEKKVSVHRLVATAFIPNPDNLPFVNHKDENKSNNIWTNLEWCTDKYNNNYGTRTERAAKSKSKPVRCIETGEIFNSIANADKWIDGGNVCASAKRGLRAGGYHWEYVDEDK